MTNVILIFSGGALDDRFAEGIRKKYPEAKIIAADRGIEATERLHIKPDFIIGDFDSASEAAYQTAAELASKYGIEIERLNPMKNDTDTEAAVKAAMQRFPGEGSIYILGGTGTRLDHVLGNVSILGMGHEAGKEIFLVDSHNRVRMLFPGSHSFEKSGIFGTYVSFFPIGEPVTKLILTGFKYGLNGATLTGLSTRAVSNEVKDETANVTFSTGRLLMIESED